ncbi:MAG TPA: V-type ATPase 116kDa subunit family protein [Spirochaetales bacterium]|nr:V-type ATPase 116kDa subunit family protein [Spirochaetales bacterium]
MSPVPMRKLELHVLRRDIDPVIAAIGEAGCFQLAARLADLDARDEAAGGGAPASGQSSPGVSSSGVPSPRDYSLSLERLGFIRDALDLPLPTLIPPGAKMPGEEEDKLVAELAASVAELQSAARLNAERRTRVREALDEARALSGIAMPFRELDHLSFLAVRIGSLPEGELQSLEASLGDRAILLPVDGEGTIVAAAAKKGRYALDTELARAKFRPKELPPDFTGVPPEVPAALERELSELDGEAASLAERKRALASTYGQTWASLSASYAVARSVEELKASLDASELVYRLEGWVPRDSVGKLLADLERLCEGRVAVRTYRPEELPAVRSGTESVPVLLKRRTFVSSFESLVVSYGAPLYGTVDPTPLVAFFFVLLFSIMFGDVGQGLVILITGLVLRGGRFGKLAKWRKFGPIFIAVGLGSMVMGFLDGSVFADEELLVPLSRRLSMAILGRPLDRFITIMPDGEMGKLFAFFGFTVGVGALINSVGLVVNIWNKLKLRKYGEALFAKTGLAGALFFWWALGMGIRVLLGGPLGWFDALGLGAPLLAVFCEEPLGRLVEGRARASGAEREGLLAFLIKGLVELIESISYYFSNTLSFLRVGAFALSHAVLSFIVFTMGDLMRERLPAGTLWMLLVFVVGNAIIIVLEGMIVAIQVVRLQYYEFFSKFFTETGELFAPFRFEYRKE